MEGKWSGRRDLNSRPHAPQACALPGCATYRPASGRRCGGELRGPNRRRFFTARLSPPFEKRQESAQRVAQVEQHLAAEQLARAIRAVVPATLKCVVRAAFFAQVAARAGNRESLIVQQPLD